ncbi:hypothetical protein [Nocardia rhamnosiphila]|uniref:Uncharacterized protein n=1 Tax=Nocardia rhamnosiphila TaxID=426716 RepID=A0ABV2X265_9NOCA
MDDTDRISKLHAIMRLLAELDDQKHPVLDEVIPQVRAILHDALRHIDLHYPQVPGPTASASTTTATLDV